MLSSVKTWHQRLVYFPNLNNLDGQSYCTTACESLCDTRYKQNRDPLIKTLLHSATTGQNLHRVPLKLTLHNTVWCRHWCSCSQCYSPYFLAVLSDLCHIQNAALFRWLEGKKRALGCTQKRKLHTHQSLKLWLTTTAGWQERKLQSKPNIVPLECKTPPPALQSTPPPPQSQEKQTHCLHSHSETARD